MPGGPYTPRPDLGPGVGFGTFGQTPNTMMPQGSPDYSFNGDTGQAVLQSGSNNPAPIQGMPTSGMGDGKASDMGRMAGNMLGQGIPNMFNPSDNKSGFWNEAQTVPGGNPQDMFNYYGNMEYGANNPQPENNTPYGGPQMIGGAYGQPIYGKQPSPMPPNMYS